MAESRPPFPPFTFETATQKVHMAEDATRIWTRPCENLAQTTDYGVQVDGPRLQRGKGGFADSPLKGNGFKLSVPREIRAPAVRAVSR
jgi:hypothetical protein